MIQEKNDLQNEAKKYDLSSLIALQTKRQQNICLFEDAIRKEREASQQEESAEANLSSKLRMHESGLIKLNQEEYRLIVQDIPKLKSTREKREQTIVLLKKAILEEEDRIMYEGKMIRYLENCNDDKDRRNG